MMHSFKGEDESDDRGLDEISDLLGLVSGTSRPNPAPTNRDYVTHSMMEGMRAQLEDTIQRQIKFQVEQELKKLDEKCDVILVKIPVLESRTDEITILKKELEEERLNRGDDAQNFMKCIKNLMEEIVQVGVKLSVAQEQIDEFEKRRPGPATPPLEPELEPVEQKQAECDKLMAKVTKLEGRVEVVEKWKESSATTARLHSDKGPTPKATRQCESDVVEMVFDLSKNLEAKFQEFGDSQTGKLMVLEERIGEVERKKDSHSHQQRHNLNQPSTSSSNSSSSGGGSEAVGMVFDLSKDIQGQFKEFREGQAGKLQAVEKRLSKLEKKKPEQSDSSSSSEVGDLQKQIKSLVEQQKQAKTSLQEFEQGQTGQLTSLKEKMGKIEKWKDSEQTRSDKNVKRMNDISKDMQAKFQEFGVSQAADIVALEERIGEMEKWKEADSERFQACQDEAAKTLNDQVQRVQNQITHIKILTEQVGEIQKWKDSAHPQGIKKIAEEMIRNLSQTWKADLRQVQVIQQVYDVTLAKLKEDVAENKQKPDKGEVVQMTNELGKTVEDRQRNQFNLLEKRLGRIEKWKEGQRPQTDNGEVVELIGALTNDIKTKFEEVEEIQKTFRGTLATSKEEVESKLKAIHESQQAFQGIVAESKQELECQLKTVQETQNAVQGILVTAASKEEMESKFQAISKSQEDFQEIVTASKTELESNLKAIHDRQNNFQGILATTVSRQEMESKFQSISRSQEVFQGIVTGINQEFEQKLQALEESQKAFQGILDASKLEMESKFQAIIEESHDAFQGILADFKEEVQSSLIALEGNLEVVRGKVEESDHNQEIEKKLLSLQESQQAFQVSLDQAKKELENKSLTLHESQEAFKVTLEQAKEEMEKRLLAELVQVNMKFMVNWKRIEELERKVKFPVMVHSSSFSPDVTEQDERDCRGSGDTLAIQYEVGQDAEPKSSKKTRSRAGKQNGKAIGKETATSSRSVAPRAVAISSTTNRNYLEDPTAAGTRTVQASMRRISEQIIQSSREERGEAFPVRIIKVENVTDANELPGEECSDSDQEVSSCPAPLDNLNEDKDPGDVAPTPDHPRKRANELEKETSERRSKRLRTSPKKLANSSLGSEHSPSNSTPSSRSSSSNRLEKEASCSGTCIKTRTRQSTSGNLGEPQGEDDSPKTLCCNPLFESGEKSLPAGNRGLKMLQRSLELSKRRSSRLSSHLPGSDHDNPIVIKTEVVDGEDDTSSLASPKIKTRQGSQPVKIEPMMSPPKMVRTSSPASSVHSKSSRQSDSDTTPRRRLPRRGTPVQEEPMEGPSVRTRTSSRRSSPATSSTSRERGTTSKRGTRAHPILITGEEAEEEVDDVEEAIPKPHCSSAGSSSTRKNPDTPSQAKGKKHGKDPSKPLLCLCGQEFGSARLFNNHIKYQTKKRKLSCKICGTGFDFPSQLQKHLQRKHKQRVTASSGRTLTRASATTATTGVGGQDQANASPDNKKLAGGNTQQKASLKATPTPSSSPTGTSTQQPRQPAHGIGRKVFENGKKRFYCKCGRSFHHKLTQERHIQENIAGKKFTCGLCQMDFLFNSVLKNHMREAHHMQGGGGKGQFACSKCGEVFKNRKLFTRHHRSGIHRQST